MNRMLVYSLLGLTALMPISSITAREYGGGIGGGVGGNYRPQYDARYQNYNYYEHNYGTYGNPGYANPYANSYYGYGNNWVYPYPDPESEPGMGDDSNALYQSYLRNNDNGY